MKIKRLEIHGFKSFVDKVVFDFTSGVTAIVGPNGCGKSNVVDAIRWVMGEQSAKNLRGRAMEDVIFGGSEFRKPLGMAEVSLVFSTDDGRVPAKYFSYAEIQVTRRLYRDGESEYLLNKTPCRLMDIAELFMDTGVGARAYSIIEQGKIGMILLSKPEERRFLIEEAAGVTKFKARKQVALKKIDTTRQNLLRLSDIVGELRRQLGALQRQAKKAERFRELREELKRYDLAAAARQFAALEDERTAHEQAQAASDRQVVSLERELATGELELERRHLILSEAEKGLALAQEAIFAARSRVQAEEGRLEYQRKELQTLERRLVLVNEEQVAVARQHAEAVAELTLLRDRSASFASDTVGEEQLLQDRERELEELLTADAAQSRQLEELRRTLFSVQADVARQVNLLATAGRRLQLVLEKRARQQRERTGCAERQAEAVQRVQAVTAELDKIRGVVSTGRERLQELATRNEDVQRALVAVERELQEQRTGLGRAEARLLSLQQVAAQFAGFGQGVKRVLTEPQFNGRFVGVLADCLETDAEHEVMLETVLGERLQYLVGGGDSLAGDAIAFLKETSGGRCSFLSAAPAPVPLLESPPGTVPLLHSVVLRSDTRAFLEPLLTNVFVAGERHQAISLARQHPNALFVTRDGDLAHGGGVLSGGSTDAAESGIMHTKREIKDLERTVATLTETVTLLIGRRDVMTAEVSRVAADLSTTRQEVHAAELRLVTVEKDLQRGREELAHLDERLEVVALEEQQLAEEQATLDRETAEAEVLREQGETRRVALEGDLAARQEALAEQRSRIETLRQEVTELKVRSAALLEKRDATRKAIDRLEQQIAEMETRRNGQEQLVETASVERENLEKAIAEGAVAIAGLVRQQQETEAASVAASEGHTIAGEAVTVLTEQLKGVRQQLEKSRHDLTRASMQLSELAIKTAHLESSLLEKYRLTIPELIAQLGECQQDPLDERHRINLQGQIDELGEVNLTAIDQFRELEERHEFLTSQRGDLEESLRSLQQAIQRINRTTRKRFMETFALVNEKFKEVFPRLFCGGCAELRLTNEEDLLETGIDIIVQPPGKKLQNVSLLSGGEKALTAVALIFSIFLIKPSPFCLLDEVDAPLDDANIGRFNEMIREMTSFSQFILITHSKTTMAVADTLYGVTMEEPGVSKLVSVKLN